MPEDDEDMLLVKRIEAILAPHDRARQERVSEFIARRVRAGVNPSETPKAGPMTDLRTVEK